MPVSRTNHPFRSKKNPEEPPPFLFDILNLASFTVPILSWSFKRFKPVVLALASSVVAYCAADGCVALLSISCELPTQWCYKNEKTFL